MVGKGYEGKIGDSDRVEDLTRIESTDNFSGYDLKGGHRLNVMLNNEGSAISRYALAQMALSSAVELDRYQSGEKLHGELLARLADALTSTSAPTSQSGPTRFFAVGYHKPYMRLYGGGHEAQSVSAVRALLAERAARIRGFLEHPSHEVADELASFCADLHHELSSEQLTELRLAKRRRTRAQESIATASFS